MSEFNHRSDEELARSADSGLVGQGSVVEAMRRLKESIQKLDSSSAELGYKMLSLTRWITYLTIIVVVLTAIMALPILNDLLRLFH